MTWRNKVSFIFSVLCLVWCIAIGFVIWFTPIPYESISNGVSVVKEKMFSEVSGYGALPLFIPVLIAVLGTWGAWTGWRWAIAISTLLLLAFTVISGFSIGAAYIPAVGLQLVGAVLLMVLGSNRTQDIA